MKLGKIVARRRLTRHPPIMLEMAAAIRETLIKRGRQAPSETQIVLDLLSLDLDCDEPSENDGETSGQRGLGG